jgi:RIO kinase 1
MSSKQSDIISELDQFFAEGQITEVLHLVKSGKEATVYCCQAHPSMGVEYLAAKIYRSRHNRGFKNDSVYQEGRVILDKRLARAFKKKTRHGREAQYGMWLGHEFATLEQLYAAGASIPRPIAQTGHAILMEYIGDYQQPAPVLNNVELEPAEAREVFALLMRNIRLWLSQNFIHGDLSPFNILYWEGTIKIIDFPQAVDPRFNANAFSLLARDIENVYRYLANYGVQADPVALAEELWAAFVDSEL